MPPPADLDAGVAWHYGSPFTEQRRLASGKAIVDLSHLGVVAISGPDRLSWLHDLTTAYLKELQPGDSRMALLLDPNGRIEHALRLVDDGTRTWLILEPTAVSAVIAYLESMRFMLRVEIEDRTGDMAVVGIPEGAADTIADLDGCVAWRVPAEFRGTGQTPAGEDAGGGSAKYVPDRPGVFKVDEWLVPRDSLAAILSQAGRLAGTWAWEAERVGAGVPRVGVDTDARTLPHEVGLIGPAVHLDKGCYRGQESVARTHNMGRPPRRLVQVLFDDSDTLPTTGAEVSMDGRRVGRLGSVANHADLGPVGLALVKRNVPTEALLRIADHDVRQVEIVARN